mmetsp:Transcript_13282/g.34119  ORF Transcript_13282/g.34119 Transcript_13282/m.34119 type:complete len:229 (+) Transcript_13282:869-1555(+)
MAFFLRRFFLPSSATAGSAAFSSVGSTRGSSSSSGAGSGGISMASGGVGMVLGTAGAMAIGTFMPGGSAGRVPPWLCSSVCRSGSMFGADRRPCSACMLGATPVGMPDITGTPAGSAGMDMAGTVGIAAAAAASASAFLAFFFAASSAFCSSVFFGRPRFLASPPGVPAGVAAFLGVSLAATLATLVAAGVAAASSAVDGPSLRAFLRSFSVHSFSSQGSVISPSGQV